MMYQGDVMMTHKERLEVVFAGKKADRMPILSGWIACARHICTLSGVTEEEYWKNPVVVSAEAYRRLDVDGLIGIFVPQGGDGYRNLNHDTYARSDKGMSLEECLANIESLPEADKIRDEFDLEKAYLQFREVHRPNRELSGDMLYMPAVWNAGARITWFFNYGYENFFYIVAMYPDHARKLMEVGGAQGLNASRVVARAAAEGNYPKAVLLGEDICTQRGPMVSPDFIEKYYIPELKAGLKPLLDAGIRPVWHSDGDVRALMDMLIDAGIKGFQGFQPECGMHLAEIVKRRGSRGEKLLIFGPLAVTTELNRLSPDGVRRKVREAADICAGQADLVLFTSNTINPDVPLENIQAMYEAARECT
jgi:hypothetical protein